MRTELPKILALLQDKAGVQLKFLNEQQGLLLYVADLTDWHLRLSDRSPIIVVQGEDLKGNQFEPWSAVLDLIAARAWKERFPIVIVEGDGRYFKQQAKLAQETLFPIAVLDNDDAQEMSVAKSCRFSMMDSLLMQIKKRTLLPYEVAAPVTGSAFFGRHSEIQSLTVSDSSFAITGVRRIGKTSLLKEAERRMERKGRNTVFLICSTLHSREDFVREIIRTLRPIELDHLDHHSFHFTDFLKRMPRYKEGPITLFLDEVDELIARDKAEGYPILHALRDASISRQHEWQYVFAGSDTLERACADTSSPLFNMAQHITLGPFSRKHAAALVTLPFESVRIKLVNATEVIDRIYRETGGHPNLIQHYCVLLADLVDQKENRHHIEVGDLPEVYTDRSFRDYVLRSVETNTAPMERLIVYLMADRDNITQTDIDRAFKRNRIIATFLEIDEACERLESIAVFTKIGKNYQFSLPLLPKMLKENYELDYLVMKVKEEMRK